MNPADILDHVPADQRPTGAHDLTADLEDAERRGWTTDTLAAALLRKIGPDSGPGAVVWHLRKLATLDPPRPRRSLEPVRVHTFVQDRDNAPGWCTCGLPIQNRHHADRSAA